MIKNDWPQNGEATEKDKKNLDKTIWGHDDYKCFYFKRLGCRNREFCSRFSGFSLLSARSQKPAAKRH